MVLAFVIGLHVLFGVALVIGTAAKYLIKPKDTIVAVDIKPEDKPDVKEPPPPPPDFKPPPVAPPPSLDIPTIKGPPSETALAAPKVQAPPAPKAAEPAGPPPVVNIAFSSKGRQMLADTCSDMYPTASKRLNEEGVVKLLVFVAPDGHATDAKVETSSGFPKLDEANVACVKRAGKAFEPQKVGGQAVGSWMSMSYRWKLT